MCVSQQLNRLIAEKCTSKLQLTDTDFSKQFKSQFRKKLQELRSEWQAQKQDSDELCKVTPKEIVISVVAAQQMRDKNLKHNWVLRGLVRNRFLLWRPKPQTGKMEQRLQQPWAQEAGLGGRDQKVPSSVAAKQAQMVGLRACSQTSRLESLPQTSELEDFLRGILPDSVNLLLIPVRNPAPDHWTLLVAEEEV